MSVKDFNQAIDFWINEVEQYNFIRLCTKPSASSWSLGQVCMHLIESTDYFIAQIKICIATNNHAQEEASPAAKVMFINDEFPDAIIEGPPSNLATPQPDSKEQVITRLIQLKEEISKMMILISVSSFKGKTKHPGLHYFNAMEWLQFAEMHFRHHLRQKRRIDEFLKIKG